MSREPFLLPLSKRVSIICSLLLLYAFPCHSQDQQGNAWLVKELSLLKQRISGYGEDEDQARQALGQARSALQSALKSNNAEAERISKEAITIAEEALVTVQRQKARDETRLKALENALKWKSSGRGFGVTGTIKGEVLKKSKAGSASFDGKSPLIEGDTIETGKDGFVEIILPDHSFLSVGPDTALEVLNLDSGKMQSVYKIIKGKSHILRACLKYALEDRGLCWVTRYRVPNAAIAVRGTEFSIEINPQGTSVTVLEGEVEVTEKETNRVVKAGGMESVFIGKEGSVQGPNPVRIDSIRRWWED